MNTTIGRLQPDRKRRPGKREPCVKFFTEPKVKNKCLPPLIGQHANRIGYRRDDGSDFIINIHQKNLSEAGRLLESLSHRCQIYLGNFRVGS